MKSLVWISGLADIAIDFLYLRGSLAFPHGVKVQCGGGRR
jgi:hypothetical protein